MTTSDPSQTANRRIARAAATVMAAFIFSSLIGLVRGIVIAHAFGTSEDLDSFNSANRITELLFNLVAGGALASAFIPTFSGFLTRDDRPGAWPHPGAGSLAAVQTLRRRFYRYCVAVRGAGNAVPGFLGG